MACLLVRQPGKLAKLTLGNPPSRFKISLIA